MLLEQVNNSQRVRGRPLTPWELPRLLEPMHKWHRSSKGARAERPHFLPILAFVYRNRYALASQIQRRFATAVPSDRTARRHLAEMESLGYLAVAEARSTSPLWPKVYFVTRRGVRRLREGLAKRNQSGTITCVDRGRREGVAAEHLLHEILITEFMLQVWQTVSSRDDLELLTIQRRSLERDDPFVVSLNGRETRLKADAMFVYRQHGRGLMCSFVELDNGTMSSKQMRRKYRRYEAWSETDNANAYLCELYQRFGARNPPAVYRLLVIARDRIGKDDCRRLRKLHRAARGLSRNFIRRLWLTTAAQLSQDALSGSPLNEAIWRPGSDFSVSKRLW